MGLNKRPETMERITTKELADKFIAEQIEIVGQFGGELPLVTEKGERVVYKKQKNIL